MISIIKISMFVSFLAIIPEVCPLKCYNCVKNSLAECEKTQSIVDCPSASMCSTSGYNISIGVLTSMQMYVKTCAGSSSNCSSLFNEIGNLRVANCTFLKRCSTDYCNGVPPTTANPVTSGMSISTRKGSTVIGPSARVMSTKGPVSNGSRLQSTLGIRVVIGLVAIMYLRFL